jgi:hypothetical protein
MRPLLVSGIAASAAIVWAFPGPCCGRVAGGAIGVASSILDLKRF